MAAPLIEDSIEIDASPEKVWSVVSDLRRMGEWSPQCKKMIVFGGDVKLGTRTFNINRRGALVWPTRSKVVTFEPNKELAFRIAENNTVWSFRIEPTETGVRLHQSRTAKNGETSKLSSTLVDKVLGGEKPFEAELTAGIRETLGKIQRATQSA
ncbi:SRPBCC family protein [Gordonia neofelifaecis]|uniref:Polyketide cyclase/dehydrase n=1 Tax=Gordonia neofelifaecis NRRL B-59395 TaxID=644548 RepID=F1YNB7_9ACTN|nr:SRPBCC family protein [Gordonia neofelifaecis]EGD53828.1 polyketide cyclase/dehydrase [Gordonia neofelifaecis NRRL B-59395]